MGNAPKGFSLVELLVVAAIAGILAAIAFPTFADWRRNMEYKQAARDIASILRDARQRAIATNREHRVEFQIGNRRYQLTKGNKAANSTNFNTVIKDWATLPAGVNMMRNTNCDKNTDKNIEFNPNGRSVSQYICVMDADNAVKYKIATTSTTGRVRIE